MEDRLSPAHHLFPQWLGSAAQPGEQAQPERTRRLVVLGLLLLNGLVVALCVALLVGSRQHDLANARLEALTDARLTAQAADAMFDKATIALGAVAAQVERQLRGAGFDAATLWQVVDAQAGQVAEIDRIGVFDEQGAQRCGVPTERCQHLDVSDRPYFQRLHDHPEDPVALYGPYAIRPGGQPALVLAQPLRLQGGGFGGVAIAVLPLDRLRHLVTTARMGSSGSVSLRSTGLGLLVRAPELTGADALETGQRVSDTLRAALAASPAEGAYVGVTANDGIERVTASTGSRGSRCWCSSAGPPTTCWHPGASWPAGRPASCFCLPVSAGSWVVPPPTACSERPTRWRCTTRPLAATTRWTPRACTAA